MSFFALIPVSSVCVDEGIVIPLNGAASKSENETESGQERTFYWKVLEFLMCVCEYVCVCVGVTERGRECHD